MVANGLRHIINSLHIERLKDDRNSTLTHRKRVGSQTLLATPHHKLEGRTGAADGLTSITSPTNCEAMLRRLDPVLPNSQSKIQTPKRHVLFRALQRIIE